MRFTCAQLAELQLPGYPTSRQGWDKIVKEKAWPFEEFHGKGRGGIRREYVPPPEIMALIEAHQRGKSLPEPENALYWEIKLDNLKKVLKVESDEEIAAFLDVSYQALHAARSGKASLPFYAKYKIMNRVGYFETRDVLLNLLPSKYRDQLIAMDNEHAIKLMKRASAAEVEPFKKELYKLKIKGWTKNKLIALVEEDFNQPEK